MAFTHRVRRPWGGQHPTKAGQLVDATDYRNLTQLEKLLYIVPLTETEAATANAEATAMPRTDDPLKEHVLPVPDEPRVPPGPPPPPPDQRPAMPDPAKQPPPPADQRPAKPTDAPPPPADQRPARTPNKETIDRDEAEERRRQGPAPTPGPARQHPDAHRAEQERLNPPPRRRLPE